MKKKSQAAMEFLMTYGWAMLIVLVVIGALAYFGVLSPSMLLPEKCIVATGLNCVDHIASDGGIAIKLQNSAGRGMIVREVIFSSDALAGNCSTGPIVGLLKPSETKNFVAADPTACGFVGAGRGKEKYEIRVEFSWLDSEGLTHTKNGELLSRVESGVDVSGLVGGEGEGYVGYGDSIAGYWKFDEGSGTQTADSSSSNNPGTLTSFACTSLDCNVSSGWVSNGRRGKALSFDGVNDYVNFGSPASLDDLSKFSYEFWVNPLKGDGNYHYVFNKATKSVWFRTNSNAIGARVNAGTTNADAYTNLELPSGWGHVVVTYDDTGDRKPHIYVNGVEVSYVSQVAAVGTLTSDAANNLILGYTVSGLTAWGIFDEVRIWNTALTQEEVSALYAAG